MEHAKQLIAENSDMWDQLGVQVGAKVIWEVFSRQSQTLGYVIEIGDMYIPLANVEDATLCMRMLEPTITLVAAVRQVFDEKQQQYNSL